VLTVIGVTRLIKRWGGAGGGGTNSNMDIRNYNLRRSKFRKTGKVGLKANFSFSLTPSFQHLKRQKGHQERHILIHTGEMDFKWILNGF
jgi:hypothetical protein